VENVINPDVLLERFGMVGDEHEGVFRVRPSHSALTAALEFFDQLGIVDYIT
jgi:hypothetical protein